MTLFDVRYRPRDDITTEKRLVLDYFGQISSEYGSQKKKQ